MLRWMSWGEEPWEAARLRPLQIVALLGSEALGARRRTRGIRAAQECPELRTRQSSWASVEQRPLHVKREGLLGA